MAEIHDFIQKLVNQGEILPHVALRKLVIEISLANSDQLVKELHEQGSIAISFGCCE